MDGSFVKSQPNPLISPRRRHDTNLALSNAMLRYDQKEHDIRRACGLLVTLHQRINGIVIFVYLFTPLDAWSFVCRYTSRTIIRFFHPLQRHRVSNQLFVGTTRQIFREDQYVSQKLGNCRKKRFHGAQKIPEGTENVSEICLLRPVCRLPREGRR